MRLVINLILPKIANPFAQKLPGNKPFTYQKFAAKIFIINMLSSFNFWQNCKSLARKTKKVERIYIVFSL